MNPNLLPGSLPERAVLSLAGPDTLALLERLVTHNTANWSPDEARYGALLTPQGKVIADYIALRTGDGVLIDVAAANAEDLAKRLKLFRLRSEVEITARPDMSILVSDETGGGFFPDPRHPDMPQRRFATGTSGPLAEGYDARRLACGVPEQDKDFGTAEVFPAEINMDRMNGIDLKKGCFVGQEVVSRMHRRGTIRKRTVRLEGDHLAAAVSLNGPAPLGHVTSAGKDRALALVRIDRLAPAIADHQPLSVDDVAIILDLQDWLIAEMAALSGDD